MPGRPSSTWDANDLVGRLHEVGGKMSVLLESLTTRLGRPVRSQDRRRIATEAGQVTDELAAVLHDVAVALQRQPTTPSVPVSEKSQAGDDLAAVAAAQVAVDRARDQLHAAVERAHAAGASWRRIGDTLGIAGQTAHKRFDPAARRRHAAYMRERGRRAREDGSQGGGHEGGDPSS